MNKVRFAAENGVVWWVLRHLNEITLQIAIVAERDPAILMNIEIYNRWSSPSESDNPGTEQNSWTSMSQI